MGDFQPQIAYLWKQIYRQARVDRGQLPPTCACPLPRQRCRSRLCLLWCRRRPADDSRCAIHYSGSARACGRTSACVDTIAAIVSIGWRVLSNLQLTICISFDYFSLCFILHYITLHYIKLHLGICQLIVTLAIVLLFACTFAICNKILLTYFLNSESSMQCIDHLQPLLWKNISRKNRK